MLSPTPAIDRSSLHPGTGFLIAPRVPHGLAAVVEGLTREVLRHHPEDIYVFAAHHFEKLLKLREQYHAEEYSGHEFNYEFNRDFNLWPAKNAGSRDARKYSNGGWSEEKEIQILEEHRKVLADMEDGVEDASTDKEYRKVSKQAHSKGPTATKRVTRKSTDKETTLDARATKIMSQMPGLHGPSKNIQARDIKQELRKNKLSGEKGKTVEGADKAVRGERRSRTRISKSNQVPKEEVEHFSMMVTTMTTTMTTTTTTTTMSTMNKTSTRRPLKKVRRVESESEMETERETATKDRFENRSSIKSEDTSRIAHPAGSRERKPTVQLSEHSSGRKVSSRALSMDRIRAYVLRKFASTASLEVLRSPTYVEQVQEVIDRAVPIIKEKLEEIRRPRGKRSRSVDFGWNDDSFHQRTREGKRDEEEEKSGGGRNGSVDSTEQEEAESSQGRNGTVLKRDEKKQRKRSIRSGRRSRRRESDGDLDNEVDRIGDSARHNKSEPDESDEPRDTLEARLTATQNILEDISKSTSELGGARRTEAGELLASEAIDHVANVVSLPIVRPPSSKNSKNASKNGADSLTLPPISPEVPKSTKKKDELSLPVLSATNGNYSSQVKSQEQDVSKDVEEASTMRDLTSDLEDMAILPEDDQAIEDLEQDLIPDIKTFVNEEMGERDENINEALQQDAMDAMDEKVSELEELESEGKRMEEVFKDSLNATPEVSDVPPRPDSLEPAEDEVKLEDENTARDNSNRFDGLKDKLMEIEMAERGIEKALAGQQIATCEEASQAEKSTRSDEVNEAGMSVDQVDERETVSKKRSMDKAEISIDKEEEKRDHDKGEKTESTSEAEKIEDEISDKAESLSKGEIEKSVDMGEVENKSLTREANDSNATEMNKVEKLIDDQSEVSTDAVGTLNEMEKSINEPDNGLISETERTKNETEISETRVRDTNQAETSTRIMEEAVEVAKANERKKSTDENERPTSGGESPRNDADELAIKVHVEDAQSVDTSSQDKEISEAVVSEIERDNEATKSTAESSDTVAPEKDETSAEAEAPEADESATTSPLSVEMPRTYVLSEGSPCEIPESVTTVIIPDRPYSSPVTPHENQSSQLGSARKRAESVVRSDEGNETREEGRDGEFGMEVFGEYIRAESNGLLGEVDLKRGVKAAKLPQDMVHQDLDKIKEEGEEEAEEKEDSVEGGKVDSSQERGDEGQEVEKWGKPAGTLENIMEHEESEETVVGTSGEVAAAEKPTYESLPDTAELMDANMTDNGRADVGAVESTSTLDNSSEESGSTAQDNHRTTTSSERKESITSNRSIESSSLGRPIVPELNLDSLQDNTVSSFKMTTNDTAKDNSSPRGSDATTSLIEPLTSDERLMNRSVLMDPREEASIEQLNEDFSRDYRDPPDQLYQAEQVEYEWLEKDPLSLEIMSRGEVKSPRDGMDSTTLPDEDVGPLSREKEGQEMVSSEEEIARELIGSLNATEMQLYAEEPDSKEESKDSGGSIKSDSAVDDDKSVPSISVAELERKEQQTSLDEWKELDNEIAEKTELQSRSLDEFTHMASQADKDENDIEIERSKSIEGKDETMQVLAPLAQFEQDESLERKSRPGTADEEIPVESKPIVIDADSNMESQEKREDEETSVEEGLKSENEAGNLNENDETNYEGSLVSEKEVKDEEENIEDAAAEGESVRESITSARSEQSLEDHPHGGYWAMGTKSSTVETVIETVSPAASISDEVKADVSADVSSSEVIATESLSAKKIDFYAVVKIQACIRGFLARRRVQKELSKSVSTQKIARDDYSMTLEDTSKKSKTGRRLQRGEALRSTTLSLENAFASGRLQHTSEFHDCIPLPIFDATNVEFDSTASNETSSKEENVEQAKEPDVPRSGTNESDPDSSHNHDNEHARNFQKSTSFAHSSAFPVVMHLMMDPSRNFRINESYDPNFNPTVATAKSMEQAMDILMLGLDPRDEDNGYLNFITSVEDLGSNANSLSLDDVLKLSRDVETAHGLATCDEDSIREPLALPGTPQGVVIEEVTSLDGTIPSPATPKTSLDANSSLASEERGTAEDEKDDLGTSPATADVRADWEHVGIDGQKLRETIGGLEESEKADSHIKDDGSEPRDGRNEEQK